MLRHPLLRIVTADHARSRQLLAEGVGTAFLLAAIVGSGIMGDSLAGGNVAIALLANTLATAAALVALIVTFGSISGAHFNPVVTIAAAAHGNMRWTEAAAYVATQIGGACAGVLVAHGMFGKPLLELSLHARSGGAQMFSEFVATFGLLIVIACCSRARSSATPFAVAAYIAAAYWFTASTSFANPAVTVARAFTDTFAGIRPVNVPGFVAAQVLAMLASLAVTRWLLEPVRAEPLRNSPPPNLTGVGV